MTKYEVLYIISPKLEEAAREGIINRFKNLVIEAGGSAEVNKWGIKKLAYPINFLSEGFYVLMDFIAPESLVAEIERQMRITDGLMRFMVTRKTENKLTRAESERKARAAEKAIAAAKAREEAAAAAEAREAAKEASVEEAEVAEAEAVEAIEVVAEAVEAAEEVAEEAAAMDAE